MAYHMPKDLDPAQFKDNLEALWIFAHALLASAERGKLQEMPSAGMLSIACAAILDEIEATTSS